MKVVLLLAALVLLPGAATAQEVFLVTELGNLIEIKPPLAAPKVVNQPYIDRHLVGKMYVDTATHEVGILPPYLLVGGGRTINIIPNWAEGFGPYPLYGGGPPNGEIFIDEIGEQVFVGMMDPVLGTYAQPLQPTGADWQAFGDITVTTDIATSSITLEGHGKMVYAPGGVTQYLAVNYICPPCGSVATAHLGTSTTVSALGSPVTSGATGTGVFTSKFAEIRNFGATYGSVTLGPALTIDIVPEGISHDTALHHPALDTDFIVDITGTTNTACPLAAHPHTVVNMTYLEVSDILRIRANNTDVDCEMTHFTYDLYNSAVTLDRPVPLRPGYNFYDTQGGNPVLVINVNGWARLQIMNLDIDNPRQAGQANPNVCCAGFVPELSVKKWTRSGVTPYGNNVILVLHDAEIHHLAFAGPDTVSNTNRALRAIQDVLVSFQHVPRTTPLDIVHDPDQSKPSYNGVGSPPGGPYCADGAKYCVTLFKAHDDLSVNLYAGKPELYDIRNHVQLVDNCNGPLGRHVGSVNAPCNPVGSTPEHNVPMLDGVLEIVDLYAVVPYAGAVAIRSVHISAWPCDSDSDGIIEDSDFNPIYMNRLPYLTGDYGADSTNGTTLNIPMLQHRWYACIKESNYPGEWRELYLPSLPIDGGLSTVLGDTRITKVRHATTIDPTVRLLNDDEVFVTRMVMPRAGSATAEIRYEIGMGMSGFTASSTSVIAPTILHTRDRHTDIKMEAWLHIYVDRRQTVAPIKLVDYDEKFYTVLGVVPQNTCDEPGEVSGGSSCNEVVPDVWDPAYCTSRFWLETPYESGILTRSFVAPQGGDVLFIIKATASIEGTSVNNLCHSTNVMERIFTEIDVRQLTVKLG